MIKPLTLLMASTLFATSLAMPNVVKATPSTNTGDNLVACQQLNSEDPNISLGGCLGFLQTIYVSHDHGWVPHYCEGLRYYEPDVFSSNYDSLADCIITNEGNPPF